MVQPHWNQHSIFLPLYSYGTQPDFYSRRIRTDKSRSLPFADHSWKFSVEHRTRMGWRRRQRILGYYCKISGFLFRYCQIHSVRGCLHRCHHIYKEKSPLKKQRTDGISLCLFHLFLYIKNSLYIHLNRILGFIRFSSPNSLSFSCTAHIISYGQETQRSMQSDHACCTLPGFPQ